jgi:hypothetical protein
MTLLLLPALLLNLLVFSPVAPGPQGEGALAGDTLVWLATGATKAVEDLVPGERLQGWGDKGVVQVEVKAVVRKNASGYWAAKTSGGTLRASGNLWVATAAGTLIPLERGSGQSLLTLLKATLSATPATFRQYPSNLPLFNVELTQPGLFFAGGLLVHD